LLFHFFPPHAYPPALFCRPLADFFFPRNGLLVLTLVFPPRAHFPPPQFQQTFLPPPNQLPPLSSCVKSFPPTPLSGFPSFFFMRVIVPLSPFPPCNRLPSPLFSPGPRPWFFKTADDSIGGEACSLFLPSDFFFFPSPPSRVFFPLRRPFFFFVAKKLGPWCFFYL